jgi:hypothetical protein
MGLKPLYNRGDTVYLSDSAGIGRLEGYRVGDVRQIASNRWLYQIEFLKKPPATALIGDTYDGRLPIHGSTPNFFFAEEALVDLCTALTMAVNSTQRQITNITNKLAACTTPDPIEAGAPRFAIDDAVYFKASARIGFIEGGRIRSIFEVGTQPGSQAKRYEYSVNFKATNDSKLYFREDELITLCEAYPLVLAFLNTQLARLQAQQAGCP